MPNVKELLVGAMTSGNRYTYKEHIIPMRVMLAVVFPKVFVPVRTPDRKKKPLAIGIHDQILRQLPWLDPHLLTVTLHDYVTRHSYLKQIKGGGARFNLDGSYAGIITDNDEVYAKAKTVKQNERYRRYKEADRMQKEVKTDGKAMVLPTVAILPKGTVQKTRRGFGTFIQSLLLNRFR